MVIWLKLVILSLFQSSFFYWIVVCFAIGIGLFFVIASPFSLYLNFFVIGLLFLFALLKNEKLIRISLLALFLCLGYTLIQTKTQLQETLLLSDWIKKISCTATIEKIEQKNDKIRLTVSKISSPDTRQAIPQKTRVTLKKSLLKQACKAFPITQCLNEGDHITFVGTFSPIMPQPFPGSLDLRRQSFYEGIEAYGYIYEIEEIKKAETTYLKDKIQHLRHVIDEHFEQFIAPPCSAIASALITGTRGNIPDDVRQNFVDAGIAHILAISGLHLTLIAGIVFFVVRFSLSLFPVIAERFNIKKIAAFLTILMTFFYLAVSGFGIPAERAFVMTTLSMIAIMFDRSPISMRLLAFAAMIILILYPESLLSASFQLSFAAVIALIAFYESGWQHLLLWAKHGGKPRKFALYFGGILLSTLIASTATTFYSIQFFNRMTLQSILGNLLSIPVTSFVIMPLAFFSTLVLPFAHLFHYILLPFELSLKALIDVAGFVSHLPGAAILIPSPPFAYGVLVTFGGLFLCLNHTKKRMFGLIPILLGVFLCFIPQRPMILMSLKELAYFDGSVLYTTNPSNSFELSFWMRHLGLTKEKVFYGEHVIDIAFKTQQNFPLVLVGDPWKMMKKQRLEVCDCNKMIITNGYKNYLCPDQTVASPPSATTKAVVDRSDLKKRGNCFLMDLPLNNFSPLTEPLPLLCTNDVCKGYPWCFY